jgi:hypothetical protein
MTADLDAQPSAGPSNAIPQHTPQLPDAPKKAAPEFPGEIDSGGGANSAQYLAATASIAPREVTRASVEARLKSNLATRSNLFDIMRRPLGASQRDKVCAV